jgi:hypothetical protein
VDGFNARFVVEVSREALAAFYEVSLKAWEGVKEKKSTEKKGRKENKEKLGLVTLTFRGNTMVYDCDGQVEQVLIAGGKALADVLSPQHWNCHSWNNCPMAAE